jgi:hypothetical protein
MKGREEHYHRKPWSVSVTDAEKAKVKDAAPRLRNPYGGTGYTVAEFGRAVVLDWAEVANALPEGETIPLPSKAVRRLQEQLAEAQKRVRELEDLRRTADLEDDTAAPAQRAPRRRKGVR